MTDHRPKFLIVTIPVIAAGMMAGMIGGAPHNTTPWAVPLAMGGAVLAGLALWQYRRLSLAVALAMLGAAGVVVAWWVVVTQG